MGVGGNRRTVSICIDLRFSQLKNIQPFPYVLRQRHEPTCSCLQTVIVYFRHPFLLMLVVRNIPILGIAGPLLE